jgi:hypothetical protein
MAININVNANPIGSGAVPGAANRAAVKNVGNVAEAAGKAAAEAEVTKRPGEAVTTEKQSVDVQEIAVQETSKQGDELKVTERGLSSSEAGGRVEEKSEDGVVARREDVKIESNEEAMEAMKAQIKEARDNQAKHMEDTVNTANEQADRMNEKREVMIEQAQAESDERSQAASDNKMVDNLIGKSKSEVERLYREGRVSRIDYEKNMAEREERLELTNQKLKEDGELVKEVAADEMKIAQNAAVVEAVQSGNQDVLQAAIDATRIE